MSGGGAAPPPPQQNILIVKKNDIETTVQVLDTDTSIYDILYRNGLCPQITIALPALLGIQEITYIGDIELELDVNFGYSTSDSKGTTYFNDTTIVKLDFENGNVKQGINITTPRQPFGAGTTGTNAWGAPNLKYLALSKNQNYNYTIYKSALDTLKRNSTTTITFTDGASASETIIY